jgi:hypothetical protein
MNRKTFFYAAGLSIISGPASYEPDGITSMLKTYGPIYVGITPDEKRPDLGHVIVIVGIESYEYGCTEFSELRVYDPYALAETPGSSYRAYTIGEFNKLFIGTPYNYMAQFR